MENNELSLFGGSLALSQEQLNALARHGAQARIEELRQEIAAIERAFPQLRRRGGRPRKQASAAESSATSQPAARRRRTRGWSASQRKAAADRMKAYWAKRKAGRKK
jgi:hypothetical protein